MLLQRKQWRELKKTSDWDCKLKVILYRGLLGQTSIYFQKKSINIRTYDL